MVDKQLAGLVGIVLLVALLCSCSVNTSPSASGNNLSPAHSSSVKVVVTSDFGKSVLLGKRVVTGENTTALDALRQVAEVETKYGGGFINSINGISSQYDRFKQTKNDWLLYINGISTNVGALDYIMHPGDTEHWDFHNWSFRQFVPAIIGDFPEPFLHGYGGVNYSTIIVYQDGWKKDAKLIADRLSQLGVDSISVKSLNELGIGEKEASNLILLGTIDYQPIEELNRVWDRLGFYVYFTGDSLQVFNMEGDLVVEYKAKTGMVQATQSPWHPGGIGACENVVWMVSGLDGPGVKSAVDTLVDHYTTFRYACGVVIADGEIIRVPQ